MNSASASINKPSTSFPCSKPTPQRPQQPNPVNDEVKQSTKDQPESEEIEVKVLLKTMERMIKCLQRNEDDVVTILKSLLNIFEACSEKKDTVKKLMCPVLTLIDEHSTLEDIEMISSKFRDIMLPEKLRCLVIDSNAFEEVTVTSAPGSFNVLSNGLWNRDGKKIKVLIKKSSQKDWRYLKHEAKMMTQLHHPNIVKILGIIKTPFSIVMEHMSRGTLYNSLKERFYTSEEIVKAILEIVSGMEYMAAKKIIHADLSLKNIFVDKKGTCKIGDLGFSCFANKAANHPEFLNNLFDGTNIFIVHAAPEVLMANKYSTESDVYSMGFLIWEMYMIASKQEKLYELPSVELHPYRIVLNTFLATGILLKPNRIPERIYEFVKCGLLNKYPHQRPTFSKIKEVLSQIR